MMEHSPLSLSLSIITFPLGGVLIPRAPSSVAGCCGWMVDDVVLCGCFGVEVV